MYKICIIEYETNNKNIISAYGMIDLTNAGEILLISEMEDEVKIHPMSLLGGNITYIEMMPDESLEKRLIVVIFINRIANKEGIEDMNMIDNKLTKFFEWNEREGNPKSIEIYELYKEYAKSVKGQIIVPSKYLETYKKIQNDALKKREQFLTLIDETENKVFDREYFQWIRR
jgi:hypothetical protein